jgi:hypothetical protein
MIWAIKDVVDNKDFLSQVREQILGILNSRHNQIFGNGNLSTSANLYLSGAYLNPGMLPSLFLMFLSFKIVHIAYLQSDLFRRDLAPQASGSGMEDILHISTFKKVTVFLVETAEKEILHGNKDEFTRWKGRASEFMQVLLDEMKRYARQQYPFNQQIDTNQAVITWWQALQGTGSDHAQVLPVSCNSDHCHEAKSMLLNGPIRFSQSKSSQFVSILCQKNEQFLHSLGSLHLLAR